MAEPERIFRKYRVFVSPSVHRRFIRDFKSLPFSDIGIPVNPYHKGGQPSPANVLWVECTRAKHLIFSRAHFVLVLAITSAILLYSYHVSTLAKIQLCPCIFFPFAPTTLFTSNRNLSPTMIYCYTGLRGCGNLKPFFFR